ncbi:uncharacterized protein F5891DRAFT_1170676 [Suillus fuscotomentosus]|uniref:Uncharacterized protein n=1 Tax=Suillus fuscotomentosus TaxID=1912939 RepID=A0AAD4EEF8_9AGAM|nr:uncharacterized protein F5891DRAFT_1170676 [Suillus fuscotomentosus]KAG1904546.1 hypothetical protein F5891DRAFT_1170676 [Suillus fuscotomentosus]
MLPYGPSRRGSNGMDFRTLKFVEFDDLCTQAPTLADQQSLTRLHAFISEASRWRPVAPNGVSHRTTKDVILEQFTCATDDLASGKLLHSSRHYSIRQHLGHLSRSRSLSRA